jgi:hypothetical protein
MDSLTERNGLLSGEVVPLMSEVLSLLGEARLLCEMKG